MNSMVGLSPAEAPVAYFFCLLILPISSQAYPCVYCQKSTHLNVENLSPRVTEYMLTEIFAVAGPVQHVKIIPDRRIDQDAGGLNHGFVEYMDMRAAETAFQVLNGRKIFDTEIRVNRAYQGEQKGTHWHLYVTNLNPRVTEYMLTEIFSVAGPVQHVKIITDRRIYHDNGLNYGFVEYMDMRAAEIALQVLNGRKIFDTEIRVNWAYQGQQNKEDTPNHFHVFIGDLPPEVNDTVLAQVFTAFGSLSDARVMWDMNSGKSLGYGFVAFRDKTDAEQAIALMNGERLGSRVIRVTWANQKTQGGPQSSSSGSPMRSGGTAPARMNFLGGPLIYETVVRQTDQDNTTVYVGNLGPYCTQADLIPLFQSIGYLSEIRMHADRGFAFVKLDTHEHAAMAIIELHGHMVHGRPIKCSWD